MCAGGKCERCGNDSGDTGRGRPRKYCRPCAIENGRSKALEYFRSHSKPKGSKGGRPRKTIEQHIADGTLRLSRHRHLALNTPRSLCKQCGADIFGRQRRFCNEFCRKAWWLKAGSERDKTLRRTRSAAWRQIRNCELCSEGFTPYRPNQYKCDECKGIYEYECTVCERRYRTKAKERNKCCGGCKARYTNEIVRKRLEQIRGPLDAHPVSDGCCRWLKRWRVCVVCGQTFRWQIANEVTCSRSCREKRIRIKSGTIQCRQCGLECPKHKKYCLRCALERRIANDRRNRSKASDNHEERAKRYGVPFEKVNPRKVFERDGWRCKCCGVRVTKAGPVWHNMRAELGHIIAMSKGGGHLYSNVQCECRRCNAIKGDTINDPHDSLAWNTLTMLPRRYRTYVLIQHTLTTIEPPARGGLISVGAA